MRNKYEESIYQNLEPWFEEVIEEIDPIQSRRRKEGKKDACYHKVKSDMMSGLLLMLLVLW